MEIIFRIQVLFRIPVVIYKYSTQFYIRIKVLYIITSMTTFITIDNGVYSVL